MSKKRKAEEVADAEPEKRQKKQTANNNNEAEAVEPAVKKSKKRKDEDVTDVKTEKRKKKSKVADDAEVEHAEPIKKKSKKIKAEDETQTPQKSESAVKGVEADYISLVEKKEKKAKKDKSFKTEVAASEPASTAPDGDASTPAAPSSTTAGEKRQAKSERPKRNKKGKIIHTREMALERNRLVQVKKVERKEALKQARLVPLSSLQQTAATNTTPTPPSDTLASGSDFVPLFTEDTKPTNLKAILPEGAQLTSITNEAGERMVMMPKKSKKGLTKFDRKAKSEANREMMKAKTAKKKAKKARKLAKLNPDPITEGEAVTDASSDTPTQPTLTPSQDAAHEPTAEPSAHRFILFIGNLPFTTTTPSLEKHFASLTPISIRHSTDKLTSKSKGFAFIEFASYDKMKTCLKLYHHSYFHPEKAGEEPVILDEAEAQRVDASRARDGGKNGFKDKGRRINVELTAGGGGKGDVRKEKLRAKNQKLGEQRERRVVKEKAEKEKERVEKAARGPATGVNVVDSTMGDGTGDAPVMGDIHPSRMSRVHA